MTSPTFIPRYIKLVTKQPLEKDCVKLWYDIVKSHAPSGVMSSVQSTDDTGSLRSATLVHRELEGNNEYVIPLTRDLSSKEVKAIVDVYNDECDKDEWDIETSSSDAIDMAKVTMQFDEDKFENLCKEWAKHSHEMWVKERQDSGWSYGISISTENKTHPLIRPWHELPEKFQKVDNHLPQTMLDFLDDQGYSVVSKNELAALIRMIGRK